MSSVGSSDSSNRNDEAVRRAREEKVKSETEKAKSHKKEIRRMTEQHYQELENLKQTHAKQIENLKSQSNDSISSRDHKYQRDIEEMRGMHRKAQQQTMEEAARREETLRKASSGDNNNAKAQADSRLEKLSTDYKNGLLAQERTFREAISTNRELQEQALDQNRKRLQSAHEKQVGAILDERNEKVGGLQKAYGDFRESTSAEKKATELRHMQQQNRASDNLMRTVANERARAQDQEGILRDGFKDGLEKTRDRFENAAQRERSANQAVSGNLKANAMDRIDNQVRRLENEKEDLKAANVRKELRLKQEKEREVGNIRDSMTKNVRNFQEQRDEVLRQSNERNSEDVHKIRGEMGKQLTDTSRFYRQRMTEENQIQRQAYDNLVGDFEARQDQQEMTTDHRVKRIAENATQEKVRLTEMAKETHLATQRQRQDEMKALRQVMENDKHETVNRLQDQLRKQEAQHNERMAQVVSKYEKSIQSLKDQMMREQKLGAENLKRTVDELQRSHKLSVDQLEAKNREHMRQISTQQANELRQVNKRHEEKLDQVLVEVKKT